jgi:hypothetical protein
MLGAASAFKVEGTSAFIVEGTSAFILRDSLAQSTAGVQTASSVAAKAIQERFILEISLNRGRVTIEADALSKSIRRPEPSRRTEQFSTM